jgi:hypothetical protein
VSTSDRGERTPLCPSAPGHPGESVLIGVVTGTPDEPRITATNAPLEVTVELLALAEPVSPSEVFRFASTCRSGVCTHFQNGRCQLADRAVTELPEVVERLPRCAIRSQCRWYAQQGASICQRCPQIVTEQVAPSASMLKVVGLPPDTADLEYIT